MGRSTGLYSKLLYLYCNFLNKVLGQNIYSDLEGNFETDLYIFRIEFFVMYSRYFLSFSGVFLEFFWSCSGVF